MSICNGSSIANGDLLNTQVCVIGSGPAGVTVAWNLQKAGIDVILLEGSRDFGTTGNDYAPASWDDKVLLYGGQAVGQFKVSEPGFLTLPNNENGGPPSERERVYGGTSTHWGGQSRPLDAVALEGRGPNYPAWPITRAELDPWYEAAIPFCNLYDSFDAEYWAKMLGADAPVLQNFDSAMYQFIGQDFLNFATREFPDGSTLAGSNARVIINASLLDINHAGGSVQSLTVASMTDGTAPTKNTQFTVIAKRYVLALGAVANARQLLLAKVPNDNIGRYFMCHPLVQTYIDHRPNQPITVSEPFLTPTQRQLMGGNSGPVSFCGDSVAQWSGNNGVHVEGRFSPSAAQQQTLEIGSCWFWGDCDQGLYFEQAPNPASRVTLAATTDTVFGQYQTRVDWQLSDDLDKNTYEQAIKLFQDAAQAIKSGVTVTGVPWSEIKERAVVNGHHLGTTRMSETAADGVVDKNLRCHDLANLFVAGSSVWRTACIPNPTFSIITFSLRLADYIQQDLAAPHAVGSKPREELEVAD